MNGHEFAEAIRSMCIAGLMPLLVASSGSSTVLASASQKCVFDHFFLKPLDIKTLIQLLKDRFPDNANS